MIQSFGLKSFVRSFLAIASVLLLSNCGFHLRGSDLAIQKNNVGKITVYLAVITNDRALHRQIQNDLLFSGLKVTDDPTSTPYHLVVGKTTIEKKAIGVDSNGRDNEFEINQIADFVVNNTNVNKDDDEPTARNSIVVRRSFYYDGGDSIGKRAEEDMLLDSMRQELSRKIISHFLVATSHSLNKTDTDEISTGR